MTERPDLSIVICSNRPHFWPWTIYQVEKQLKYLRSKGIYSDVVLVVPESCYKEAEEDFKVSAGLKIKSVENGSSIGFMRNRGARGSDGKMIAMMDDDDWYPDFRLHLQWSRLFLSKLEVAGVDSYLCYNVNSDKMFWHMGSSESCLVFKRTFFNRGHHFNEDLRNGEGSTFLGTEKVYIEDSCELIVALSHSKNTVVRDGFELLCGDCKMKEQGSYCVECAEEMMALEKAYGKLPEKGLLPGLFDAFETTWVKSLRGFGGPEDGSLGDVVSPRSTPSSSEPVETSENSQTPAS